MLKRIVNDIFYKKISLLSARPAMGKMAFTSEVVLNGLENNKKILIITLENDEGYFLSHLISRISGLKIKDVLKYFSPCKESSKINNNFVDNTSFIKALEKLQKSKIYINSNLCIKIDVVDYIIEFFEDEKFDLIIINNLDLLIKKSKYSLSEIMFKLSNLSILIWNSVSRDVEIKRDIFENDISNYDNVYKFIDNNIVLYREVTDKSDIIKIVNYKNKVKFKVEYLKEFDRLKVR